MEQHRTLVYKEIVDKPSDLIPLDIYADGLHSVENIGMLIRICEAMRVDHVYLNLYDVEWPHPKLKRTSRGAEDLVTTTIVDGFDVVEDKWRQEGREMVALDYTTKSIPLQNYDWKSDEKYGLIIGSERNGISSEVLSVVKDAVHIPMMGQKSSINVIMATSIALYDYNAKVTYPKMLVDQ